MNFEEIEAISFDMDGVLVDSMKYHAKSFVKAMASFGVEIDENQIYRLEGEEDVFIIKDILKNKNKELDPQEIANKRRKIFTRIEETKVFEGIKPLLKKLSEKYKLSVVSGSTKENLTKFIEKFFPSVFDCMVSGDDLIHQKPHQEPYKKCLEKLRVSNEKSIVIENAPLGVKSAKNAEIFCVAVATYVEPEALSEADVVLENHKELIEYLKKLL